MDQLVALDGPFCPQQLPASEMSPDELTISKEHRASLGISALHDSVDGLRVPEGKIMKKSALYTMFVATGLSLAACSEKTQEAAEVTAESAGDDAVAAGAAAGDAAEQGVNAVGSAADNAAAATDELGNKAEQERAEVEAEAHNESVAEAKKD